MSTSPAVVYQTSAVHRAFGNPRDVVTVEKVPKPSRLLPTEILVKIHYAAINPVDWKFIKGNNAIAQKSFPIYPGFDLAGTVEHVGSMCKRIKEGDEIYAVAAVGARGSFAEYIVIAEELASIKPARLTMAQAAAVPLVSQTSWQGIELCELMPGQKILILGGSSGTGNAGIQIAKARDCYVATTCSGRNAELCKRLGADRVIDYTKENWGEVLAGEDFDSIYDCVGGGDSFKVYAPQVLKKDAITHFVTIAGDEPDKDRGFGGMLGVIGTIVCRRVASAFKNMKYNHFLLSANHTMLDSISELIENGKMTPVIDSEYPLAEINDAFEFSQTHRAAGKIVIKCIGASEEANKNADAGAPENSGEGASDD
eukprot:TRINITY_DN1873_c0_g1_i1.p2 TRINITY_DN1873_c0_g1~~TRINITY_DN1873_c0_g1_i1.p2  ORF type:complete len:369 (-),score=70.95 TRINITY_DN1873_c0_g1_i1:1564-2670(-)